MNADFIPDYSKYSNHTLVDVFSRIERVNNHERAKALDDEIRKRFNLNENEELNVELIKKFLVSASPESSENNILELKYGDKIKGGWIAGLIVCGLNLISYLFFLATGKSPAEQEINIFTIADVVLVMGLTYGLYKRNKVSAVILTIYYLFSKVLQITAGSSNLIIILFWSVIIGTLLIRATIAIFEYHKEKMEFELQEVMNQYGNK